jgi:DNA invertase Pin-like site-specific DNA recombinase
VTRSLILYMRVSTSKQGSSGLGIEARRETLTRFAEAEGFTILREFVEVETGKGSDALDRRPQLSAALAAARKVKCHVAVAKLDRLSVTCTSSVALWPIVSRFWCRSLVLMLTPSCSTYSPPSPRRSET